MARQARAVHLELEGEEKTYRVESDPYGYVITYYHQREKRDGTKEDAWAVLPASYTGTFEGSMRRLLRELLKEQDTQSLEDLLAAVEQAKMQVIAAVEKLDGYPDKRGVTQ